MILENHAAAQLCNVMHDRTRFERLQPIALDRRHLAEWLELTIFRARLVCLVDDVLVSS